MHCAGLSPQLVVMQAAHCVSADAPSQKFGVLLPLTPILQRSSQPPDEINMSHAHCMQLGAVPAVSVKVSVAELLNESVVVSVPPESEPEPVPVLPAAPDEPGASTTTLPPHAATHTMPMTSLSKSFTPPS
jgi:hypothetical protein